MDAPASADGLSLLDLPAALRTHGYETLQLVHFHVPSRDQSYVEKLRAALAESGVTLDAVLIDDGDLTAPDADAAEAWIGDWIGTASAFGARRARVVAGKAAPTPESIRESARRLTRLAASHPDIRVVIENWWGMLPDADAVLALLEATGDSVGLLVDLGNWSGPDKYEQLARIAPLAETCHAKCRFSESGPDREDFRRSLQVLSQAGFEGPLALIYDGPDDDEWGCLDIEFGIVNEVFG
ncbi:MAG: TIM barrel protein [Chloroflexota bacterium]|nr:TIM barrel protein [Chloroflexota bacterium]